MTMRILAALAGLGWVLSLAVHVATILDHPPPPAAWNLHAGALLVFVLAIVLAKRRARSEPRRRLLAAAPRWMSTAALALAAYAVVNYAWLALAAGESGSEAARELEVARGFSGLWLLFYFAAFAIAWSATNPSNDAREGA